MKHENWLSNDKGEEEDRGNRVRAESAFPLSRHIKVCRDDSATDY